MGELGDGDVFDKLFPQGFPEAEFGAKGVVVTNETEGFPSI
jgi:hypothetical protein